MISSDQQLTQSCRFVWYQNSKLKKGCSNVESSSFYYHRCLVCETRMAHSWRKPSGIRSLAMGSCCEFQIHRRKQIRKRRVIGFFFDFMNEAWCPWFWKVYYRVMFSDGFCVFSSLFEIDFKWFLNFKLGYRSFTRFGRLGTSILIPKVQLFSKWPAKNQDLTSKDVLRCFLPDPAFPAISNIQGSQRV